tara:strand:- start:357 stop:836 length:480 start_codon:yes stop_codon:yes gene_type:complete
MVSLVIIFVCALVVWAAVTDFLTLKIPNVIPVFVIVAFGFLLLFEPSALQDIYERLITVAILFVVTFIMYAVNMLGAGDSKLLAVLGLWIPAAKFWLFVLIMASVGAVLGFIALYVRSRRFNVSWLPESSWFSQLQAGRNAVPYAVAIATAFLAVVFPF